MKRRLLAILLSAGIIGGIFVGCGEKKEQPKEPQKQEEVQKKQTQEEDKIIESIDLKKDKRYKNIDAISNSEIVSIKAQTSSKGLKEIFVEINVKEGTDKEMIKEFFYSSIHIEGVIASTFNLEEYDSIVIRDKKIGFIFYGPSIDSKKIYKMDSVIMSPEYEKIFNQVKEEFLQEQKGKE